MPRRWGGGLGGGLAWFRRTQQVVGSTGAVPSYEHSSLAVSPWNVADDGSTEADLTLTLRDTQNRLMAGRVIDWTLATTAVAAGQCTLATNDDEIATTTGSCVITAIVKASDGTPLPNIPSASLVFASTGSGNTFTPVDTATDRNGLFRTTFSSTSAATKTISLTADGVAVTATVQVVVTGTPSDATPDFFSDWSAATGTSATARGDGGKWDIVPTGFEVVTKPAELVAGCANVLKVPWDSGAGTALCRKGPPWSAGFGDVPVGSTRTIRFYMNFVLPDMGSLAAPGNADGQTHPVQDGNAGGQTNYTARFYNSPTGFGTIPAGEFRYALGFFNNGTYDAAIMRDVTLLKNHWYRYEIDFYRSSSTTFKAYARIYDAETVGEPVLHDSDDFTMSGAASTTLTAHMASADLTINNSTMIPGINAGTNDQYADAGVIYAYQAGLAVWTDQGSNLPYGRVVGEA